MPRWNDGVSTLTGSFNRVRNLPNQNELLWDRENFIFPRFWTFWDRISILTFSILTITYHKLKIKSKFSLFMSSFSSKGFAEKCFKRKRMEIILVILRDFSLNGYIFLNFDLIGVFFSLSFLEHLKWCFINYKLKWIGFYVWVCGCVVCGFETWLTECKKWLAMSDWK